PFPPCRASFGFLLPAAQRGQKLRLPGSGSGAILVSFSFLEPDHQWHLPARCLAYFLQAANGGRARVGWRRLDHFTFHAAPEPWRQLRGQVSVARALA